LVHSIEISSELASINNVRLFLEKILNESILTEVNFNRVFLTLSEVLNNSIVHGNCSNSSKKVFLKVFLEEKNLFFEVTDEGSGFPFNGIVDPTSLNNLKNEKGRGIFIIRQLADEVEYSDEGRKVMIRFKID